MIGEKIPFLRTNWSYPFPVPFTEVSDDNFALSLPTRLVSVAALLRRYSPSPHPLLRLLSHIPALAYSN
jgi:hypothetical protein